MNVNKKFVEKTFQWFMPKPDTLILLWADPDVILKRRQEMTCEEIIKFKDEVKKIRSKESFMCINTSLPIQNVVEKTVNFIFSEIDKKN